MIIRREMVDKGITKRQLGIIIQVVSSSKPRNECAKLIKEIILCPKLDICPHSPMVAEPGLIKVSQPDLLHVSGGLSWRSLRIREAVKQS